MAIALSARHLAKRYGPTVALADASLDLHYGEVLALIGANGSGKSTLSKIINGVVVLDEGQLRLDDRVVQFASPHAAKRMGISTVFQELSLVPQMTVAENIWLTHEPLKRGRLIDKRTLRRKTVALLDLFAGTFSSKLEPDTPVGLLPPDEKQIIEILKAISVEPRVLILDEATASLDNRQVQRLFALVRQWKQEGKAIVFVSHRMEEIFQIGDRYAVLRNGTSVGDGPLAGATRNDLVALMVQGATAANVAARTRPTAAELAARKVRLEATDLHAGGVHGVTFRLHAGELLGLGGLRGQGQHQLLLAMFGALPYSGLLSVDGAAGHFTHPRQAMQRGLALVPGERAREGLLLRRSILENFLIPSWRDFGFPLRIEKARAVASNMARSLSLKMGLLDDPVSSLSGGNAQKVVIGKWLMREPQVLMLDDPTKGIDVGAKAEFYTLLARLCEEGTAVLLYSSDDEELIGLCDRVLVMHDGNIRVELTGAGLTKSHLVAASLGATQEEMA